LDVARRVSDPRALVVTVLCDTGERYLSKVFNDEWLRENQILDAERATVAQLLTAKANGGGAPPVVSVGPQATVRQALNLMSTYNVSQLPVLDGDNDIGAVAEQSLMARALGDPAVLDRPVRDSMGCASSTPSADSWLPRTKGGCSPERWAGRCRTSRISTSGSGASSPSGSRPSLP